MSRCCSCQHQWVARDRAWGSWEGLSSVEDSGLQARTLASPSVAVQPDLSEIKGTCGSPLPAKGESLGKPVGLLEASLEMPTGGLVTSLVASLPTGHCPLGRPGWLLAQGPFILLRHPWCCQQAKGGSWWHLPGSLGAPSQFLSRAPSLAQERAHTGASAFSPEARLLNTATSLPVRTSAPLGVRGNQKHRHPGHRAHTAPNLPASARLGCRPHSGNQTT